MNKLKLAFAALVLWAIFSLIVGIGIITIPFAIAIWIFTGQEALKSAVTRFGQGLDGTANVLVLNGDPRETISSHAGRLWEAGRINWKISFIKWFTDLGEQDHILKAIQSEARQLPL